MKRFPGDDEEENEDSEVEGLLDDLKNATNADYPKDLLDERRDDFINKINDKNKDD